MSMKNVKLLLGELWNMIDMEKENLNHFQEIEMVLVQINDELETL